MTETLDRDMASASSPGAGEDTRQSRPWHRHPAVFLVGILVFLAYVALVADYHRTNQENVRRGGDPLVTDFLPFYAASLQIRREPAAALYDRTRRYWSMVFALKAAFGDSLTGRQAHSTGAPLWMHPPTFILALAPLASLPYLQSMVLWLVVTALPYLAAMRRIVPDRTAWAIALAAPPTLFNILFGQTGFLTAGLIGLGLSLLSARPLLAGICIGLASVKPHFGILIPLALLAGGHWRTFWAAAATVGGLMLASLAAYGAAPWAAFFGSFGNYFGGYGNGSYNLSIMANVLGMMLQFGEPSRSAWSAQILVMALAAAAVAWAWRGRQAEPCLGLQSAVLCLATALFVPMIYVYDLVLLTPGVAWLWIDMRENGASRWEQGLLALSFCGLLPLWILAMVDVQLVPIAVGCLLALALKRLQARRRELTPAPTGTRFRHSPG